MNKWQMKPLGELCLIERGGSPRPIDKYITDSPDGINWIKIGDTTESMYISRTKEKIIPEGMKKSRYVQKGDFLLSNSMSFGRPYILDIDGCIHDGWLVIRDNDGLFDKRFLYYFLGSPVTYQKFKSMAVGGVVNNLNIDMVKRIPVPMLSLDEQRKIANELDKVTELVGLQKQQLTKLDELVKSRFIELFVDKNFPEITIGELVSSKVSSVKKVFLPTDTIKYIDISSIDNKRNIMTGYTEYILEDAPSRAQQHIRKGDIVVSTVRPNLKNVAITDYDYDNLVASSGFCVLRAEKCLPSYLIAVVCSDDFTDAMTKVVTGANYPAIKDSDVRNYVVPNPPIELQDQFAAFVEQTDKSKFEVNKSLEKLEILKKALMQKYFG